VDQWLDWPAFGFLALLTLLDGLRRVPAGALVVRRVLGGKWQVIELRAGYRLVSWWPPLTTTVVLVPPIGPTSGQTDSPSDGPEANLKKVRGRILTLQVLGILSLFALVVVVPVGMRWWGGTGFLASLLLVLLLSWLITGLSLSFGRTLELTTRQSMMFALPRLNPFAAPGAAEALMDRAMDGANPLAVVRLLLDEAEFTRWVRPRAFDVLQGREVEREDELVKVIGRLHLNDIVSARPPGVELDTPWCPRCGSEFGPASTSCPSCDIALNR
jgi:hypothetical protein